MHRQDVIHAGKLCATILLNSLLLFLLIASFSK